MSASVPRKEWEGNYLLVAAGSTRRAPYLIGWREFKDHIRECVKEQPGWVEVRTGLHRGEMEAWSRLKDVEDAESAWSTEKHLFAAVTATLIVHADTYSNAKGILVHLFETSLRTNDYQLLKCNCSPRFTGLGAHEHSPRWSGLDNGSVNQAVGKRCVTSPPQYVAPPQPAYPYANYYQQPATYTTSPLYSYQEIQAALPQVPAYSQSAGGLPVNLSSGVMVTEARGIFIQGLSYSVGSTELSSLIQSVGLQPVEAKVHRDSKGNSKGVATAKFATKEHAQYAVTVLNGKLHKGKTISARIDTDTTVIGQIAPLVVDGSTSRVRMQEVPETWYR